MEANELLELTATACGALLAIAQDFDQAHECELPLPESVTVALKEREALLAAMKWTAERLPEPEQKQAKAVYAEALRLSHPALQGIRFPMLPETAKHIETALQAIRAAALRDAQLAAEIHLEEQRR